MNVSNNPLIRILLIEDDIARVRQIEEWLPADMRLVHAGSAGRAIGVLQRDRSVYAGIMLDHDLQGRVATERDTELSGSTVVKAIIAQVPASTPIMIHSMNSTYAPRMMAALDKAGFSVTRLPMGAMDREGLTQWLDEVREAWEDRF